jgi:hypothetical protein
MIAATIRFALSNFTLTFLLTGLLVAAISLLLKRNPADPHRVLEAFFSWYLFFGIGVAYFYNFIFHVFFGDLAARFIGWSNSPFQLEVGFASLGFSVLGFLAFRRDHSLRVAAIVGPAVFMLGAAGGHVYQMLSFHNFAPGNAGIIFYSDIFLPLLGFLFLFLEARTLRPSPAKGRG